MPPPPPPSPSSYTTTELVISLHGNTFTPAFAVLSLKRGGAWCVFGSTELVHSKASAEFGHTFTLRHREDAGERAALEVGERAALDAAERATGVASIQVRCCCCQPTSGFCSRIVSHLRFVKAQAQAQAQRLRFVAAPAPRLLLPLRRLSLTPRCRCR